jgi:Domain of unknown function (DUF222)
VCTIVSIVGQHPENLATGLSAAVDDLLTAPISRYQPEELLALLAAVDTELRRLAAVDARLVGEVDQRNLGAELGARTTAGLLGQLLRVAPGEAAARLRAARDLGPRRGLTGEELAPIFPAVADALAAGELNPAHARVIVKTMDAIPAEAEHAALGRGQALAEQVETTLVQHAARLDPRQLGQVGTRLLACLDPDGAASREEEAQRRRALHLHTRADGSTLLRGELSAETGALWTTILDALSRPVPGIRAAAGSAHRRPTPPRRATGRRTAPPARRRPPRRRRHPGHPADHHHPRPIPHRARLRHH